MNKQTVSAIIPTHNRAGVLSAAIESVCRQTRPVGEIVVVDDGSRDATAAVVAAFGDRVRYIVQDRRGVSAARNRGIRQSRGEWLAFLDSDDRWCQTKIERQLSSLGPDQRISHTDEIWIRNGRRVNPMRKHAKRGGHIYRDCLPRCVISPSSVLIHRTLLDEVGLFDESLPACEDYDLWLRICAREAVGFVSEPLVVKYGGHEDQLSRRVWGLDRFRIQALERMLDCDFLAEGDRIATLRTLMRKARIYSQGARKRGRTAEASRYESMGRRCRRVLAAHHVDGSIS